MVYSHLTRNRIATVILVTAFIAFIVVASIVDSTAQNGDPFSLDLPTLFFALFYVLISFLFCLLSTHGIY